MSAEEVFTNAFSLGAFICSVHPMFAISDRMLSYRELSGGFFALEGCRQGIKKIQNLLIICKNPFKVISAEAKVKYHCAAAVASNLANGLMDMSLSLLEECGFSAEQALSALSPIMINNIKNIAAKGTANSLTGPIERNDVQTVEKHLSCLEPKEKEIYRLLSQRILMTAAVKHQQRDYTRLKTILEDKK